MDDACTAHAGADRTSRLASWRAAPRAREAHPREEHLLPLLVAAAAGGDSKGAAQRLSLGGVTAANYVFSD